MRKPKPLSDISVEDLKQIYLRKLARAPQTRAGLVRYAIEREIPETTYLPVINRFIEVGLINDAEYAAMYVRSRRAIRGSGPKTLRMELQHKGIEPDLIDLAVAARPGDDFEVALKIAERKLQSLRRLPVDKSKKRVLDFLLRRGYDYTIVSQVLAELNFELEVGD
jgi:regulatory protein